MKELVRYQFRGHFIKWKVVAADDGQEWVRPGTKYTQEYEREAAEMAGSERFPYGS